MTGLICPVCAETMAQRVADHVGAYDALDCVFRLDGDTRLDFCKRCGLLVVGFNSDLVVFAD